MRRIYVLLFIIAATMTLTAQTRVVDAVDAKAVPFASVITSDGRLLGMTDGDGMLPEGAAGEQDFVVQHIVYDSHTVTAGEIASGVITLTPRTYDLTDIVVKGSERDYVRLRGYCRRYAYDKSGKNRILSEGIIDYYLPLGKKSGKNVAPVIRAARTYSITRNNGCDSVIYKEQYGKEKEDSEVNVSASVGSFMEMDSRLMINSKEMAAIDRSATKHIIQGKHWPMAVWRRGAETATLQVDALADKKKHAYSMWGLKLLGITVRLDDMIATETYRVKADGKYGINDLLGASWSGRIFVGGKLIRKHNEDEDMEMRILADVYFTEGYYMSDAEAKAEMSAGVGRIEIVPPAHAPQLNAVMAGLKTEVLTRYNKER